MQEDKLYHIVAEFLITIAIGLFTNFLIGIVVALFIGILKEIYDHYFGSGFSWGDIIADLVGIGLGVLCLLC